MDSGDTEWEKVSATDAMFLRKHVFDKVDARAKRASNVEDYLSEQEREFLRLVQEGDIEGIKKILQTVNINADCCDYRGQRALDIAVANGDLEIVTFLLDNLPVTTVHYYCAVLQAVFENEANILEMLLDRAEEDNKLRDHLRELINGGPDCGSCLPEVATSNMTPTMAAATSGNVEITRLLLERGYIIRKPHSPKCQCRDVCAKRERNGETLTESISRINAYRALASPTYLILTSEDPILGAFELSLELEKLARELPENQKEYQELSKQCSKFAATLLHQCRNTEEVQLVLIQKAGLKDQRPHRFSRLHLAVQYEQKEFITHASCQQVLRTMWVGNLGSYYSWSFRWRAFHVLKNAFMTPFVAMTYIFLPRAEVLGPLRIPLNRFIYFAASYLFFLSLLMGTLLNDRRYDVRSPVTWTEIAVCCFVLGHSWDIFINLISVGVNNYFRSWWAVFDLVMFSMFLVTEILWFSIFIFKPADDSHMNRMTWKWYHPILLGEGIYAAASVMAFSRLLLWFQVNNRLGPLGTSIKYMIVDVFQFFTLFFIIMLAFATGINSIYKNYKDSSRMEDNKLVEQPEAFLTLKNTFKNLFWAIFGMGEPDFAQIVVGNSSSSGNILQDFKADHAFTEGVGYSLWGLYHMITVVVLLNMLIAMMTESYQRVLTNADMEWKFACSTLWLSVLDNPSIVPPPFNLIPSMHRIAQMVQWIMAAAVGTYGDVPGKISWSLQRCCYWDPEGADSDYGKRFEEDKYEKLMVQLIRRYLHNKGSMRTGTPTLNDLNLTEEFKKQLKEEITQELRRSLKIPQRRYTKKKVIRNVEREIIRPDVDTFLQPPPSSSCQC